jgi:hypothetical protein
MAGTENSKRKKIKNFLCELSDFNLGSFAINSRLLFLKFHRNRDSAVLI